jgi:hypothetical protein
MHSFSRLIFCSSCFPPFFLCRLIRTKPAPLSDRAFAAALRRIDQRQMRAVDAEAKQHAALVGKPAPAHASTEPLIGASALAGDNADRAGGEEGNDDAAEAERVSWWETVWPIAEDSADASTGASPVRLGAGADANASGPVAEPSVRHLRDLFDTIRLDIDAFAFKTLSARMRY